MRALMVICHHEYRSFSQIPGVGQQLGAGAIHNGKAAFTAMKSPHLL
jgi:hypothetical protein